ncbi:hypothetical protein RJT34_01528 [Clitoria ternatea]|uniref:VQ domain-containing protein n=1 Tax=Clitoria ternatea TaxID=43366 RepID=A0AAN9KH69_CLITE
MMKNKRGSKRDKLKEIKVTYISSPVKVKTSASNFRALVQELTGQYSNVAETTTSIPVEEDQNCHFVHPHKGSHGTDQHWRVDGAHDQGTDLLKPGYNHEFLSRSYMEPFNQHHLQYDLLSFDMS